MSRTNTAETFNKGDRIYKCHRCVEDKKFYIFTAQIIDVEETFTPKGRPRPPVYILKGLDFTVKERDKYVDTFKRKRGDIEGLYTKSATAAVKSAMKQMFASYQYEDQSPSSRLLRAVFDDNGELDVNPDDIPKMIADLKQLHGLYAQATRLDHEELEEKVAES